MAVTGPVTEVMRAGGSHIPALLDRVEQRARRELAGGHGALLAEHAGATIAAGGKRLRPLLVFLAADAEEGEGLVRAATAVELVHSATLVHDDVLDAASLRRGVPTVVAAGGRGAATATGDLLFARAFAELAANGRADEIQVLSEASSALAEGELLQRADAWNAERVRSSATCAAASSRPRACSRRRAGWARSRPAARPRSSAPSGGASAWPSSSSTTSSTSRARPSAPASSAGPTCSTAR